MCKPARQALLVLFFHLRKEDSGITDVVCQKYLVIQSTAHQLCLWSHSSICVKRKEYIHTRTQIYTHACIHRSQFHSSDIWVGRGTVLVIVGYLAASLASTH